MFHFGPIVRALLQRKLHVFLMVIQLSIVTAIFSTFVDAVKTTYDITKIDSGIAEHEMFAITVRPIKAYLTYDKVQRDLQAIKQLPYVESVSAMRWSPLSFFAEAISVRTEASKESSAIWVHNAKSTPEVMNTLKLPIIAGRNFNYSDMALVKTGDIKGASVVIITNRLAETLFGSANQAVGKFLYEGDEIREIIGVSQDWWGFMRASDGSRELTIFRPQHDEFSEEYRYLIRVQNNSMRNAVVEQATALVSKFHDNHLLLWVEKIDESRAAIDAPNIIYAWMMLVMLVVLAIVVAFAVSAQTFFSITQRFKQLGIRRALGATQRDIMIHIQTENMLVCFLGLLVGFPFSIAVSSVVMAVAGGLPVASWCIAASCGLLIAICFLSAHIPLKKMANISPCVATRSL